MEELQKEIDLRNDLKRVLVYYQLIKRSLEAIRISKPLKKWAEYAKANKNKSFVDFRGLAANQQRSLDVMVLNMKKTIRHDTWNILMKHLADDNIKEIDLLLDEVMDLDEATIAAITQKIDTEKKERLQKTKDYENYKTENENSGDQG